MPLRGGRWVTRIFSPAMKQVTEWTHSLLVANPPLQDICSQCSHCRSPIFCRLYPAPRYQTYLRIIHTSSSHIDQMEEAKKDIHPLRPGVHHPIWLQMHIHLHLTNSRISLPASPGTRRMFLRVKMDLRDGLLSVCQLGQPYKLVLFPLHTDWSCRIREVSWLGYENKMGR